MNQKEDNLDKYIRKNRKRFDRYRPDSAIRNRLFLSTEGGRKLLFRNRILRAASVAILIGSSLLLAYNTGIRRSNMMIATISPELRDTEIYYESLMNSVFNRANTLFLNYPGLEGEIMEDIGELEHIGRELRADLKDNIANREVVEALIRNYRLRIQLLEDLIESIPDEKNNKEKALKNEL